MATNLTIDDELLVIVRDQQARDREAVRALNESAFGSSTEADLVEALHRERAAVVALVAEMAGEVVGHILFSPVEVEISNGKRLSGLAPMAVAPPLQRRGIGSLLVREGLQHCRDLGYDGVVLVGHAEYYPRFGFVPAHTLGLRCEYDVPPEVFMALELADGSLGGVSGLVRYHGAFAQV
ncbi:MAG TPA: N-acetyltransferase [Thermoanaerobaculia bacterium]|nr:N-acetyltransferase [Thermoanaerobaculia bacterium]